MDVHFRWVAEDRPGKEWVALLQRAWPMYRDWFLGEGDVARPQVDRCEAALLRHMPELLPTWHRLIGLAGPAEKDLVARMLSLYCPTPFLAGCSQAVWTRGSPLLVRNYDYDPRAFEGAFFLTSWHGTRVLAASDCLWGALDGVNEHGLAVALAFGGSKDVGEGFGIPLILRYLLEFSRTVEEAAEVLRRVPSHMAYNVSLLDRSGAYAVAYLGPGRATEIAHETVCTNHQPGVHWPEYAAATASVERRRHLVRRMRAKKLTTAGLLELFLAPPLYATGFDRGYGTLYTAVYDPESGRAEFRWPGASVDQSLDHFSEMELVVPLGS